MAGRQILFAGVPAWIGKEAGEFYTKDEAKPVLLTFSRSCAEIISG